MGRPSSFSDEIAAKICEQLEQGLSLRAICGAEGMPDRNTVHRWLDANEKFRTQYARARDRGLDVMADELLEIADTPKEGKREKLGGINGDITEIGDMLDHRRLQVDTRKWYLSKLAPKRYGDRLNVEHSGEVSVVDRLANGRKRTAGA